MTGENKYPITTDGETFGTLTSRVSSLMKKELSKAFNNINEYLTPEEFSILSMLWENGNMIQSDIVEKTKKDKAITTRLLNSLTDKGFVKKSPCIKDKRNFEVFLTEKGISSKEILLEKENMVSEMSLNHIDKKELEITMTVLKKVYENLTKY